MRLPMQTFGLVLTAALLGCTLSACTEDSTAPESASATVPDLPPSASLQMDLRFFTAAAGGEALDEAAARAAARWNWISAVVHVTAIDLMVGEVLGPPAAVFELALSADPKKIDADTYLWEYEWREGEEWARVALEGSWVPSGIEWALRVSGDVDDQELENALWFHGRSSALGSDGHWIFTDLQANPTDIARLDWTASRAGARELVLEIIDPAQEDFGDYVAFRASRSRATIEWRDGSLVSYVKWDESTGAGSLQVPGHNGGEPACWDPSQEDVDCPSGEVSF